MRHGADLEAVIAPARVENNPIRCAVGSNVLHIAALTGNVVMAKMILEAQVRVGVCGGVWAGWRSAPRGRPAAGRR